MTRRHALSLLASALPLRAAGLRLPRAGAQTNAWRISNFDDLIAVLARLRNFGYAAFETSFRNVESQFDSPSAARERIRAAGVEFANVHIWLEQYDPQTRIAPLGLIEKTAHGGAALGASRLVLSGLPCVESGVLNRAALRAKVAGLHHAAQVCREAGLRLAYHNEGPEFEHGGLDMAELLKATDPALVGIVLDAGHVFRMGGQPIEFFLAHHKRIVDIHLRDFRRGQQQILGDGDFDLTTLARAIHRTRWNGLLFNEEERLQGVKLGDAAIEPARRAIKKIFGV